MTTNITRAPIMGQNPIIANDPFTIETPGATGASTDSPFSYLTPDALMAYCQTRLQSTDSQMQKYFDNEKQNAAAQQAISTLEGAINCCVGGGINSGNGTAGMDLITACQNALQQVGGPSTPAGAQIVALRDTMASRLDPKTNALSAALDADDKAGTNTTMTKYQAFRAGKTGASDTNDATFVESLGGQHDGVMLNGQDVQGWATQAQGIATNLGNDSQMGMIQLQSLMSERQTSIQMCTNLVQSLGDQSDKITGNIGH